ncbi:hypothetical protein Egran_04117 [Elaphomyces granulatus]|uniref:Potassium channel domain-containing protein n=1 Tax=Elaphomyces granulatus TaxID=519963 RepID=A0A232LVF6_9EURO|nr:hypothetical protein Egran_04117 [Elaphomyces granulatus]
MAQFIHLENVPHAFTLNQLRLSRQEKEPPSFWMKLQRKFRMRPPDDDEPQDWWVASTVIPLVAATTGPLANVMSIIALVSTWRNRLLSTTVTAGPQVGQIGINDPQWCISLNAASLACGIAGNIFLLFNFTQRIRYIIALPASIILWSLATGILIGITSAMYVYTPPIAPNEVFSQGFWSAVIAAVLYLLLCVILLINMLGYFLGHYPQHFALTDDQRTLILQTTLFEAWLAVGGAIFTRAMGISFADAVYFSDVTILTLGFGDVTAQDRVSKGLIFPYAVVGIIMLGLVVASVSRFARELTYDNVVKVRLERKRARTFERSLTITNSSKDIEDRLPGLSPIKRPLYGRPSTLGRRYRAKFEKAPLRFTISSFVPGNRSKTMIMKEEKDRFNAMRAIQRETMQFKRWTSLAISFLAFIIVWCGGAAVFWQLESVDYFDALYFGFVTLLSIGYGDVTPKTNLGRPFFVVWSLIAVPTMAILISKMSDTVTANFNSAAKVVADWTVLPKTGKYRQIFLRHPLIYNFLQRREEERRIKQGFQVGPDMGTDLDGETSSSPSATIERFALRPFPTDRQLARQLGFVIRNVSRDVAARKTKRYSYEEWVEFTRLIRFTDPNRRGSEILELDESEYGLIEWDWIGENSPMLAEQTEPEWVLNRLCESLLRYLASAKTYYGANGQTEDDEEEEAVLEKQRDLGILDEDMDPPASKGVAMDKVNEPFVSGAVDAKISFSPAPRVPTPVRRIAISRSRY